MKKIGAPKAPIHQKLWCLGPDLKPARESPPEGFLSPLRLPISATQAVTDDSHALICRSSFVNNYTDSSLLSTFTQYHISSPDR